MARNDYFSLRDICRRANVPFDHGLETAKILDVPVLRRNGDAFLTKGRAARLFNTLAEDGVKVRAARKRRLAALRIAEDDVVYFIRCAGFVKIGHAFDPVQRLGDLQHGNPIKLTLIGTQHGGVAHEQELHARFWNYRERGEWFRIEGDLAAFLEAFCGSDHGQSREKSRGSAHDPVLADAIDRVYQRKISNLAVVIGGKHEARTPSPPD